jgi:G patch domain-containing protein 1
MSSISAGDAQDSAKFVAKGTSESKFSIFDVLNAVPQAGPSFMSSGYENIPSGPVQGPANKVQELEWDKAERGELEEKAEPDLVPDVGPSEEIKEETKPVEVPYERPPMDVFKAIFADTDSEDEEEEEEKEEENKVQTSKKSEQPKPPVVEDIDDDAYGPRLPVSSGSNKVAVVNLAASQEVSNHVEWVERKKEEKKKKDKKKKSKKKKD